MAAFLKVVSILGKHGQRPVKWAWAHRSFVISLIKTLGVNGAVAWILRYLGIG